MHHARAAREPGSELPERGARLFDVAETERGEPLLGCGGFQSSRAGEGVEQWREEQPLVNRPHHRNLGLVLGVERFERGAVGGVAEAEHAGEVGPLVVAGGERVRLVFVDELEPMLDGTQPDVRGIEGPCVSGGDVAPSCELFERVEGRARSDRRIVTAVHELQQLHRELDVADSARTALEFTLGESSALQQLLGLRFHRTHFAHSIGVERIRPQEGIRARRRTRRPMPHRPRPVRP